MEPDSLSRSGEPTRAGEAVHGAAPLPPEWRALARLRDRVEASVREIERLRAENASLAARVGALQDALGDDGPGLALPGDPETLRARVQGFIDALDRVLDAAPGDDAPANATPDTP